MAEPGYLTRSRFKLACECETKLHYTKKGDYDDQSINDPFLPELAKGGYQAGAQDKNRRYRILFRQGRIKKEMASWKYPLHFKY
jgi:hypothetical protein